MKRIPVPISFVVVSAITIALLIFFGAWAVSADVNEQDRAFSFGFPVAGTVPQVSSANSPSPKAQRDPDLQTVERSPADSWWGQALLRACPLH